MWFRIPIVDEVKLFFVRGGYKKKGKQKCLPLNVLKYYDSKQL
jgi:hypothetical protein